jgi:hypothetical protein
MAHPMVLKPTLKISGNKLLSDSGAAGQDRAK